MAYTVKEVSEKTGVSRYTLRFYEKEGVLPHVGRDKNGVRLYIDSDIDWIETVQVLRSTGLPLAEIREYVELYKGGRKTLQQRKTLMTRQKNKVEEQISRLIKTLEKINYKLALFDAQEEKFEKLP
ncbi:MerR family transcriptional regulator [Alicyclobacillus dauci]|uniref:MerR family transcriptional regulator n=1 Tax=Alicyclobacillus dauci TaxID=1475485 RepID=A0ABY6Z955_9BACL|nr:MerR family transcriptional regulator [Alicyclobacillus dauci]WAH39443.1 MerR family transcriptional regulator [Alicyclobacillus dauci]